MRESRTVSVYDQAKLLIASVDSGEGTVRLRVLKDHDEIVVFDLNSTEAEALSSFLNDAARICEAL